MEICINAKQLSKRKHRVAACHYSLAQQPENLRDLIRMMVVSGVNGYNSRIQNPDAAQPVSAEALESMSQIGKIGFGIPFGSREADPEEAVKTAIQGFEDGLFRFFDGENLTDLEGKVLSGECITVAHPFHLYTSEKWVDFQKHLFDNKIIQPFRQVFRELYVKTGDEFGTFNSLRYAGNRIQPKKAAACLKERRWVADIEAGLQKVYYRENIVATIYALADWFTPEDIEATTLEYVAFYHRKTGKPLKIDEIPDVIFSEVMRDVDPETSHSTVEMRAAILGFTLPLLRLTNVRVEASHAFIDGKLAKYSVHLGSGVVHQIGGTMLNVLPVHSQHRGRIFLPFVDDDPKTPEIISKVILFSEDKKLKDPTILSQITA